MDSRAHALGAHHSATRLEHVAFRDAIRSAGKPIVSVEDGALAVGVGYAAERSVKQGRPVPPRELGF